MLRLRRCLFAVLASVAMAQTSPSEVAARLQPLDAYMAQVMKDFNSPGIGIAVVSGDQLVFAKGYGYRDYGRKLPFTPRTLFQIASNSKLFTAVSAGMLVEEGKLAWGDRVVDRLPGFQMSDPYVTREMRIRDLLCHRSGLGLGAGDLMFFPHHGP